MLPERVPQTCKGGSKHDWNEFWRFRTLLILGLIASIVMHAIVRNRTLAAADGFALKWIAGWIGAS